MRGTTGFASQQYDEATAHDAWADTRRQRAEYCAGARAIRRGERNEKKRGTQRSNGERQNQTQGHQKTQA